MSPFLKNKKKTITVIRYDYSPIGIVVKIETKYLIIRNADQDAEHLELSYVANSKIF